MIFVILIRDNKSVDLEILKQILSPFCFHMSPFVSKKSDLYPKLSP